MELSNVSPEQKDVLDSLRDAIVAIEEGKAKEIADNIVNEGIDPNIAIRYSIADAAIKVGEKFDSGEYFLPHLVMAGDLMDEVSPDAVRYFMLSRSGNSTIEFDMDLAVEQ